MSSPVWLYHPFIRPVTIFRLHSRHSKDSDTLAGFGREGGAIRRHSRSIQSGNLRDDRHCRPDEVIKLPLSVSQTLSPELWTCACVIFPTGPERRAVGRQSGAGLLYSGAGRRAGKFVLSAYFSSTRWSTGCFLTIWQVSLLLCKISCFPLLYVCKL